MSVETKARTFRYGGYKSKEDVGMFAEVNLHERPILGKVGT